MLKKLKRKSRTYVFLCLKHYIGYFTCYLLNQNKTKFTCDVPAEKAISVACYFGIFNVCSVSEQLFVWYHGFNSRELLRTSFCFSLLNVALIHRETQISCSSHVEAAMQSSRNLLFSFLFVSFLSSFVVRRTYSF